MSLAARRLGRGTVLGGAGPLKIEPSAQERVIIIVSKQHAKPTPYTDTVHRAGLWWKS